MSTAVTAEKTKLEKGVVFSLVAAISTILASAIVVMWAIIAQPPGDTVGKAFLTIFIASGFTFALIGEVRTERKAVYVMPGRIAALVAIAASGLWLTWNQIDMYPWADFSQDFAAWLGVIILLEGISATLVLFWPNMVRNMKNPLVRYTFDAGVGLVILVSLMISFAWTTYDLEWSEDFWRVVLAVSVLALVMFAIPLVVSMILAPKKQHQVYAQYPPQYQAQQYVAPVVQQAAPAANWDNIVAQTADPIATDQAPQ